MINTVEKIYSNDGEFLIYKVVFENGEISSVPHEEANRAVGQVNLADDTANYINITGVQLEAGTVSSDFEFLPVDVNLQRCLRYYIKLNSEIYGNNNYAGTNTSLQNYYMFREVMRAAPTITVGTPHNWSSGPTAASATSDGFRIYGAGGNVYIDSPGYIANAEL